MQYLKLKALLQCFLLLSAVFSVSLLVPPVVDAREDACCEKTLSGEYCVYTAKKNCDLNYNTEYAPCDKTAFCRPVCCVDSQTGKCYKQVSASKCASLGGVADAANPLCTINQCTLGCCQIGNQCSLQTQRSCEQLTKKYPALNPQDTFDASTTTEVGCVLKCRQQDEGCCITKEGCISTTLGECTGDFKTGKYCSDASLSCGTKAKDHKGCVEGSDDVYWFDSANNKEGIAEDCDYTKGTKCGLVNNNVVCKSVDCQDTADFPSNVHDPQMGKFRYNGEMWCVYESGVGDYMDRPGSEHYRHSCLNGDEYVETGRPYREQICVQTTVDAKGKLFSSARLINNEIYDSKVNENISTVPRGFCFWDLKGASKSPHCPNRDGAELCAEATIKCPVVYMKKNNFASWKCKANCECETQEFIDKAAKYCRSKGDCGANYNVLGKRSDAGFKVEWSGSIRGPTPTTISEQSWQNWSTYGVFGGMQFLQDAFAMVMQSFDFTDAREGWVAAGVATVGVLFSAYLLGWTQVTTFLASTMQSLGLGISSVTSLTPATGTAAASGGATTVQALQALGMVVGFALLTYGLVQGDVGTSIMGSALLIGCALGPVGCAIGAGLGVVLKALIGGGKMATKTLTITCEPWVPPAGGEDCEKCDDDPWKECTEYRCRSLGAACKYLGDDQKCAAAHPNDVVAPVISPWQDILTAGLSISPTPDGYYIQPAVPIFTPLTFGIKTNELARCKISDKHTNKFSEMPQPFGSSAYSTEHKMTVTLPAGKDYTYYVRCQDVNGNANIKEYFIQFATDKQPDMTPPRILSTSLADGAYLPVGITETSLTLFLNKPSSCRWSTQNQDYQAMPEANAFQCDDEVSQDPLHYTEYLCGTLLTGLQDAIKNQFYFRCKDLQNNEQQQSYPFSLQGTTGLTITSATPQGEILTASPTLQITTAGGAEQGKASCTHQEQGLRAVPFFTTGGNQHTQLLGPLAQRTYTYTVVCTDVAGNKAEQLLTFSVTTDTRAPVITQLYSDGQTLYLVTNEPSACAYSTTSSIFSKEQGILMTGENVKEHSLPLDSLRYSLLCWDTEQNTVGPITVIA